MTHHEMSLLFELDGVTTNKSRMTFDEFSTAGSRTKVEPCITPVISIIRVTFMLSIISKSVSACR